MRPILEAGNHFTARRRAGGVGQTNARAQEDAKAEVPREHVRRKAADDHAEAGKDAAGHDHDARAALILNTAADRCEHGDEDETD